MYYTGVLLKFFWLDLHSMPISSLRGQTGWITTVMSNNSVIAYLLYSHSMSIYENSIPIPGLPTP